MAIQIRSNQIKLADTFNFSGSLGVVKVQDPTNADEAASKGYVDAQIPTALTAGDGIDITSDVVSVAFATDGALSFIGPSSDELSVKVKAESGGSITKDADGLYIADAAISNAKLAGSIANDKLANSTISGISLGSNLNSLAAAADGAITFTSYNGSAAVSDVSVQVDGTTIAKASNQLKVADGGVGSTQLADSSVTNAKLGNQAVDIAKVNFAPARLAYNGDGSTTVFTISGATLPSGWEDAYLAFRNGILVERVASSPSGEDQYTVAQSGSDIAITFGSAPASGDRINVIAILVDNP